MKAQFEIKRGLVKSGSIFLKADEINTIPKTNLDDGFHRTFIPIFAGEYFICDFDHYGIIKKTPITID